MEDRFFWELLGLEPGAGRREIQRAYHQLARENHPDFFPPDQKPLQELKMITLNEAYAYLMEDREEAAYEAETGGAGTSVAEEGMASDAVGFHREPAYAYYKQGFIHYSRAIHGMEALYQSIKRTQRIHFNPRDDAYERFASSLPELRRAHEYFSHVAEEHLDSIWSHDARVKLARIERFSELYRRILNNLRGNPPAP
jgi:DnaJ-class molecular chaperone